MSTRFPRAGDSGSSALSRDIAGSVSLSREGGADDSGFCRSLSGNASIPFVPGLDGLTDAFERGGPLAGDRFETLPERLRVVGDELRPVTRPRDLHVERLGRSQARVVGLHRGDHVVDRAPLKSVHGRGPRVIEMAQLRIARGKRELAAPPPA